MQVQTKYHKLACHNGRLGFISYDRRLVSIQVTPGVKDVLVITDDTGMLRTLVIINEGFSLNTLINQSMVSLAMPLEMHPKIVGDTSMNLGQLINFDLLNLQENEVDLVDNVVAWRHPPHITLCAYQVPGRGDEIATIVSFQCIGKPLNQWLESLGVNLADPYPF